MFLCLMKFLWVRCSPENPKHIEELKRNVKSYFRSAIYHSVSKCVCVYTMCACVYVYTQAFTEVRGNKSKTKLCISTVYVVTKLEMEVFSRNMVLCTVKTHMVWFHSCLLPWRRIDKFEPWISWAKQGLQSEIMESNWISWLFRTLPWRKVFEQKVSKT